MEQNDNQNPGPMHDESYDDEGSPSQLFCTDSQVSANESVSPDDHEYQPDQQNGQRYICSYQAYPPPMDQPGSSVPMPSHPSLNRTNSPNALQQASHLHDIIEFSSIRGHLDGLLFGQARRVNILNHRFLNGHFCKLTCALHCTFDGSFEDGMFGTNPDNEFCEYSRKRFSGSVYEGYFEGHFSGEVRVEDDDTLCLTGWFAGYLEGKFVDKPNNESNKAINSNSDFLTCHQPSTVYLLPHPSLTISAYSSVSISACGRLWIDQLDQSTDVNLPDIALKRDDCKFEIICDIGAINGNSLVGRGNIEFFGTACGSFDGFFGGSVSKHYKDGREICCISGGFAGMLTNCSFEGIFPDSIDQASSTIAITQANDQLSTFDNQFSHQANDQPSDDLLEDNPSGTSLPYDSSAVAATASASTAVNHQVSQSNLARPAESGAASGDDANDTNCTAPSTQSDDQPSGDLLEDIPSGTSFARESSAATAAPTDVNDQESQSNLVRPAESIAASENEANIVKPDPPTKDNEQSRRRSVRISEKASKCTLNNINEEEDDDEEEEASSPPVKKSKVKSSRSRTVEQPGTSVQQQQPAIQDPIDEEPPPDKFFTIEHLICPYCPKIFSENELNAHMSNQHSIERYRCYYKNCRVSFAKMNKLAQHNKEAHGNTVNWECDKCDKKCSSNKALVTHYYTVHKLGLYVCSFPKCKAEAEFYKDMINHYKRSHKEQLVCQQVDCVYMTPDLADFKDHQRKHTGIKPNLCNWPQCPFTGSARGNTLKHIRSSHFEGRKTVVENGVERIPQYYIKIIRELL